MPVRIPAGLYSAGGFKVDVSPLERVINQRQAEKKAAKEAAMKYFTSLKDKINTVGVRTTDLEGGLQDKINNWVNQGSANIDKISKGGQGYSDFVKGYQGILTDIEKSKNRGKFETELGKAAFEGKYDPDADDLQVLSKVGKSIYDPQSYKEDGVSEYTYGDIPSAVPAFDPGKQSQFFTAAFGKAKPTYREDKARRDDITDTIFVPKEYTDDDVKSIAENTLNVYYGDKSAQKHYKNQLSNESWMKGANEAFKSVYGDTNPDGSENIINTPEKAAQADAIMRAKLSGEEVEVKDIQKAQQFKNKMLEKRQKFQQQLQDKRQAAITARAKIKQPPQTIGEYYDADSVTVKDNKGQDVKIISIDKIYSPDYDKITKGYGGNIIDPIKDKKGNEYFIIRPDGSWEGKNGTIDKKRVLDIRLEKRGNTSSATPVNAPANDVAISQYPENIQRGILAFSEKNNLSLNDALEKLKEYKPEIFS